MVVVTKLKGGTSCVSGVIVEVIVVIIVAAIAGNAVCSGAWEGRSRAVGSSVIAMIVWLAVLLVHYLQHATQ